MIITCRSTSMGWYWGCFNTSTTRAPRASCFWVAWSSSEPNCANASSSRYCARSSRSRPATCFIALIRRYEGPGDTKDPAIRRSRTQRSEGAHTHEARKPAAKKEVSDKGKKRRRPEKSGGRETTLLYLTTSPHEPSHESPHEPTHKSPYESTHKSTHKPHAKV